MLDEELDELAERVAQRLAMMLSQVPQLVGVAEYARMISMSTDYVREHAVELGGIPLPTDGRRTVWRFDPRALTKVELDGPRPELTLVPNRGRRSTGRLLPIAGQDAA